MGASTGDLSGPVAKSPRLGDKYFDEKQAEQGRNRRFQSTQRPDPAESPTVETGLPTVPQPKSGRGRHQKHKQIAQGAARPQMEDACVARGQKSCQQGRRIEQECHERHTEIQPRSSSPLYQGDSCARRRNERNGRLVMRIRLGDQSTAQAVGVVIEDSPLAGTDPLNRRIEHDTCAAVGQWKDCAVEWAARVADLALDSAAGGDRLAQRPADAARQQLRPAQRRGRPDDQLVLAALQGHDVQRRGGPTQAQPPALADRLVGPVRCACRGRCRSRRRFSPGVIAVGRPFREKAAVVVIDHEAEIHRIMLAVDGQVAGGSHPAHFVLGVVTDRKEQVVQFARPQHAEHIGLVLVRIHGLAADARCRPPAVASGHSGRWPGSPRPGGGHS